MKNVCACVFHYPDRVRCYIWTTRKHNACIKACTHDVTYICVHTIPSERKGHWNHVCEPPRTIYWGAQVYSITMTSWWARSRLKKSPASRLFTQPFIQAQIKENIKTRRHWPLWGEFTGDRWIPHTRGQWRGKCFHLMTSSCMPTMFLTQSCVLVHWSLSSS